MNRFFDAEAVADYTKQLLRYKYIDEELGVYGTENTKRVLKYLGVPVKAVRVEDRHYHCRPGEYEILKLTKTGYMHFVPGDGEGNYTWDPLGVRPAQREYDLESKRIIVMEDNWRG